VLAVLALTACPDRNRGVSPDGAGLFFPAGTVLDPRVDPKDPARWMFALNANSDLVYNAGTLLPVDLAAFYASWMRDPEACFAADGDACTDDTKCTGAQTCEAGTCVTDVGARRARRAPGRGPAGRWSATSGLT